MTDDILDSMLPKWPRLTVEGEAVTKDQAAEIILRTSSLYFSCNDKAWAALLYNEVGIDVDEYGLVNDYQQRDRVSKELGILELEYLDNRHIASAYIGGPHGWVDWYGVIGTGTYNIGKWPECKEVFNDWKLIAEAWPFLKLRSQLWSGEQCEDYIVPVIEYVVENGTVTAKKPESPLEPSISGKRYGEFDLLNRFLQPGAERGCTIEMFQHALTLCRARNQ